MRDRIPELMFAVRAYSSGRIAQEKSPAHPVLASDAGPKRAVVKSGEGAAQFVEHRIASIGEEFIDLKNRNPVDGLSPPREFKIKSRPQSVNQMSKD